MSPEKWLITVSFLLESNSKRTLYIYVLGVSLSADLGQYMEKTKKLRQSTIIRPSMKYPATVVLVLEDRHVM